MRGRFGEGEEGAWRNAAGAPRPVPRPGPAPPREHTQTDPSGRETLPNPGHTHASITNSVQIVLPFARLVSAPVAAGGSNARSEPPHRGRGVQLQNVQIRFGICHVFKFKVVDVKKLFHIRNVSVKSTWTVRAKFVQEIYRRDRITETFQPTTCHQYLKKK